MTAKTETKPRRTFTPQFKLDIVNQAKASGDSISGLARKHNLNANQVFRWCHEVEQGQARWVRIATHPNTTMSLSPPKAESPTFLPITLNANQVSGPSAASVLTIEMANGHRLQLHQESAELLKTVLAALS